MILPDPETIGGIMLAVAAAVIFGIDLLLDFANVHRSDPFTSNTLLMAGLFCLALHFAGVGSNYAWGGTRTHRSRR
jgi:hypothetical protein